MSAADLSLSPEQRKLLQAALVSNQPSATELGPHTYHSPINPQSTMSETTAAATDQVDFPDDSPYLDFGLDGEYDDSFNFDTSEQMIGDLPEDESPRSDLHDKRKSVDGKDDDDEGGGKRREGDDKTVKKPGRKPLLNEPTTKRKAQNRAAQRAFRERKERHLKDLETKVEDLERASESTNHENGLLRAQVERLTIELREYRKRLSWMNTGGGRTQLNSPQRNSLGANDFQFEFPKFGDLPTANFAGMNSNSSVSSNKNPAIASQHGNTPRSSTLPSYSASPASTAGRQQSFGSVGNSPLNHGFSTSPQPQIAPAREHKNSTDSLSGLFSPSILDSTKNNLLGYFPETARTRNNSTGRQSFDNTGPAPGLIMSSSNTDSPGSSVDSQQQLSSIGTSPEPLFNSPRTAKQDYNLGVVGENGVLNTFGTSNFTVDPSGSGFDWLAQQHGGEFDPVLFGDYREAQDNILSQDFGTFFNDAYPLPELGSPSHTYTEVVAPAVPSVPKPDLLQQVDAAKDGEVVPGDKSNMLTCNKIWDRLQSMEKFRNGEIDIDNLCSELRSKAKCSEGGAVVEERHVDKLLKGL